MECRLLIEVGTGFSGPSRFLRSHSSRFSSPHDAGASENVGDALGQNMATCAVVGVAAAAAAGENSKMSSKNC